MKNFKGEAKVFSIFIAELISENAVSNVNISFIAGVSSDNLGGLFGGC